MNFNLKLTYREGGHHSGNWGGLLANPGIVMAHALATITDERGQIKVPEWRPKSLTNSVRAALADVSIDAGEGAPKIHEDWGEKGLTPIERVFGWNSFEVLAFKTGNPDRPVNAIPPSAIAYCQLRFVVGTDPHDIVPALRRHLEKHGFGDIEVVQAREVIMNATRLDPDNPWAKFAAKSLETTFGVEAAHPAQPRRFAAERSLHRHPRHADGMGAAFLRRLLAACAGRASVGAGCARGIAADDRHVLGPRRARTARLTADEAADLIQAIATRQDRAAFAALFRHYAPRRQGLHHEGRRRCRGRAGNRAGSADHGVAQGRELRPQPRFRRDLDLHHRAQQADRPAAPQRPAADRHRGLADGFFAGGRRRRQIHVGRANVHTNERTDGRPLGRPADRHPQGFLRGQDPYGHRRGVGAAFGNGEVTHSSRAGSLREALEREEKDR